MITREEFFRSTAEYPLERLGPVEDVLFFDIETTGLSADKNQVYMTGVLSQESGEWHLIQWLSDTVESEAELLDTFFSYLSGFKILVSFNGEAFDIPFLLKRCRILNLDHNFDGVKSVDIYRLARSCKNLLGLERCGQKSIENFLGIEREDVYTGGELINVYIRYLCTKDSSLSGLLLLHNADDLRGMPAILPILSYPDMFHSPLYLRSKELTENAGGQNARGASCQGHEKDENKPEDLNISDKGLNGNESAQDVCLRLSCESNVSVPVPVSIKKDPVSCGICKNSVIFDIKLIRGTLKHYFPDPANYYYLIYEDMAVHKSVGRCVAGSSRKQATAATCYVKQEGLFLPQFDDIWEPVMKKGLKDKMPYVLLDKVSFDDQSKWGEYSRRLLAWLAPGV